MEQPTPKFNILTFPSGANFPRAFLNIYDKIGQSILTLANQPENIANYRLHYDKSRAAFLNSMSLLKAQDKALILGSGNMIEIPVEEIFKRFRKINIADLSINATAQRLSKLDSNLKRRVGDLIQEDITGLYPEIVRYIDNLFSTSNNIFSIFNSISTYLNDLADQHVKIDMNKLADVFGKDSYDFVSSSFLISQLALGILLYVEQTLFFQSNTTFSQPRIAESTQLRDLRIAVSRLNICMMLKHFELIAKILKPDGVMHISATMKSKVLKLDDLGITHVTQSGDLIDAKVMSTFLGYYFDNEPTMVTSWNYIKQNFSSENSEGQSFLTLSMPCKVRKDDQSKKIDDWSLLT